MKIETADNIDSQEKRIKKHISRSQLGERAVIWVCLIGTVALLMYGLLGLLSDEASASATGNYVPYQQWDGQGAPPVLFELIGQNQGLEIYREVYTDVLFIQNDDPRMGGLSYFPNPWANGRPLTYSEWYWIAKGFYDERPK